MIEPETTQSEPEKPNLAKRVGCAFLALIFVWAISVPLYLQTRAYPSLSLAWVFFLVVSSLAVLWFGIREDKSPKPVVQPAIWLEPESMEYQKILSALDAAGVSRKFDRIGMIRLLEVNKSLAFSNTKWRITWLFHKVEGKRKSKLYLQVPEELVNELAPHALCWYFRVVETTRKVESGLSKYFGILGLASFCAMLFFDNFASLFLLLTLPSTSLDSFYNMIFRKKCKQASATQQDREYAKEAVSFLYFFFHDNQNTDGQSARDFWESVAQKIGVKLERNYKAKELSKQS